MIKDKMTETTSEKNTESFSRFLSPSIRESPTNVRAHCAAFICTRCVLTEFEVLTSKPSGHPLKVHHWRGIHPCSGSAYFNTHRNSSLHRVAS